MQNRVLRAHRQSLQGALHPVIYTKVAHIMGGSCCGKPVYLGKPDLR